MGEGRGEIYRGARNWLVTLQASADMFGEIWQTIFPPGSTGLCAAAEDLDQSNAVFLLLGFCVGSPPGVRFFVRRHLHEDATLYCYVDVPSKISDSLELMLAYCKTLCAFVTRLVET